MLLFLFPLDVVLFPGVPLPLHIFEPRYREMIGRCLSDGKPFGVVLATSGAVEGGHAETAATGTTAQIEQHRLLPDGRYLVVAQGVDRFRIVERLPDDPFPKAQVESVPADGGAGCTAAEVVELKRLARRYLALSAEADEIDSFNEIQLEADPETASFEACAIVRVENDQRQRLLEASTPERIAWLRVYLRDANQRLQAAILSR